MNIDTMDKADLVDELVLLTRKPEAFYVKSSVLALRNALTDERARRDANPPAVKRSTPAVVDAAPNGMDALGTMLAAIIEPKLSIKADMDEVVRMIDARMADILTPTRVEVVRMDGTTYDAGLAHNQLPKLLRAVTRGRNAFLYGAPGGGKTHVAKQVADALGIPFYFLAFSSQTTAVKLTGFMDAHGKVVSTVVREACVTGGVLLLDEVDKASPAVLAEVHALLAQRTLSCPDGAVSAHESLVIIACANTAGLGGTTGHETAQRMDVAFRSRFVFIEWKYDTALEMTIALGINADARVWVEYVIRVREAVAKRVNDWRVVVDPRCSYDGAHLWSDRDIFSIEEIADMCLFKACDAQTKRAIIETVGLPVAA